MLQERILECFEKFGMPKTVFCRRVNISIATLWRYMHNDLCLSEKTQERISNYLKTIGI